MLSLATPIQMVTLRNNVRPQEHTPVALGTR